MTGNSPLDVTIGSDRFVGEADPERAEKLVRDLVKLLACELAAEDDRAERMALPCTVTHPSR